MVGALRAGASRRPGASAPRLDSRTVDLRDTLALAWKRRWLVLGVFVLVVALAAAFAYSRPKEYESTATIALLPNTQRGQGLIPSDALNAILGTYATAAKSSTNIDRASRILGKPLPGTVDSSTEAGTGVLRIIGRASTPQAALTTATKASQAFVNSIRGNTLLVPNLINPAAPSTTPVQPRPPLIIAVAAVLGLAAGLMVAYLREHVRPARRHDRRPHGAHGCSGHRAHRA